MKILCLVTDAFGGHGGISKFNRDLLEALCTHPDVDEVVAVPRLMPNPPGNLPINLTYVTGGLNSKIKFIYEILLIILSHRRFDLVVCGHINLIPLSYLCRQMLGAPLALVIHGIDAWQPTRSRIANYLAGKVDILISVSEYTKNRFADWSSLKNATFVILPNSVDLGLFTPAPKNQVLLDRYGLNDKIVLMTLGRLDSRERAKGFDEIMEILPQLAEEIPNIAYVIAGSGRDRERLELKVTSLKIENLVIFTGMVSEEEKADHYRLADAYVMPSRGEGFGIVLLEAMACGIPTLASTADGSREALRDGLLGILVDPNKTDDIIAGIKQALGKPRFVPEGLDFFSDSCFQARIHQLLDTHLKRKH
jgi:glycosyltransferase involved in cell wall biosynthesis